MFSIKLFSIAVSGLVFLACGFFAGADANDLAAQSLGRYEQVVKAHRAKMASPADFKRLLKFVKGPDEKWRDIPWVPGLLNGAKVSRAKNKPMFIWAMDGDPLGCV